MARRPNIQTVKSFWGEHVNNEYYTDKKRGTKAYFKEIERRRYKHHYHLKDLFVKLRSRSKKGWMLEIGCGIGIDSVQLYKCGFDLTAIDLTEEAIRIAKERAKKEGFRIDYRTGNAEALKFKTGAFDCVYSFGVLHHTPDIQKSLDEVHRVLKKGGKAYIMLYAKYSLVNLIHRLFNIPYESPKDMKDHCPVVYTFSKADVKAMFSKFKTVDINKEYPFTYGFRPVSFIIPLFLKRFLGTIFGWHLMIEAQK